jgi:nitrite reductase/ring-hydroxylating ferredoxin subunit
METEHWIEVGRLEDIPRRGARKLCIAGRPVAVFRTAQDEVFALIDRCPHRGGPLSEGIVFGRSVACSLHNWVIGLATYFAPVNMRVNAIAPGFFLTKQNEKLLTTEQGKYTERAEQIIAHTPMSRFGKPEDLIGSVIWLCSDASKFVTGVVVPVDGGFNAYGGV